MGILKAKSSKTQNADIGSAISAATEEETKRVNVNLPKSIYLKLKTRAAQDDASISSLIRRWVEEYITED